MGHPEQYKVCEGCLSILAVQYRYCPDCGAYRFNCDPKFVQRRAVELSEPLFKHI